MRYVLDANVALKWVLPEPHSDKALRLRADMQAGVHELLAPDTFPVEVAHALARAERKGDIPIGDAEVHLVNILSTSPHFQSSLAILRRALAISSARTKSAIRLFGYVHVNLAFDVHHLDRGHDPG
jgi:predicted nucleic acid-binding protein